MFKIKKKYMSLARLQIKYKEKASVYISFSWTKIIFKSSQPPNGIK